MKTALIGDTGFVGRNLAKAYNFTHTFNSKNIATIKGQHFETLVCSGIPASMWMANNNPEQDLNNINHLLSALKKVEADRVALISTIAVFTQPVKDVTEVSHSFESVAAYGKHRRHAEVAVSDLFENSLIVRLPALFGNHLKKNFIYDLLNQEPAFMPEPKFESILDSLPGDKQALLRSYYTYNRENQTYIFDKHRAEQDNQREAVLSALKAADFTALKFTHSKSRFQFYNLAHLWEDMNLAWENNLNLLHICSKPISARQIAFDLCGNEFNNSTTQQHFDYDMKTNHAQLWGKVGPYQYSATEILDELSTFIRTQK